MYDGKYSPSEGELYALINALYGWSKVGGMGPVYFVNPRISDALFRLVADDKEVSPRCIANLARGRARLINFYSLIDTSRPTMLKVPAEFTAETVTFLQQLKEHAGICREGTFATLDFAPLECEILFRIVAKVAPVLFFMGFADAQPHAFQVCRLTASVGNTLGGRHSEILQCGVTGYMHDPKFHPVLDLEKSNLATHPVVASAIAYAIFQDRGLMALLRQYFHGNAEKIKGFVLGIVDALSVNNDSRFVQMFVILPALICGVGEVFGEEVTGELSAVVEQRLESAAKGVKPPELPKHLHGCLEQVTFDSGFRGITRHGWLKAVARANIDTVNPPALFLRLLDGDHRCVTPEQLERLKIALTAEVPHAILSVRIKAADLFHHHQEVIDSGRLAAKALVISDPMMLSPHKVASVYLTEMLKRLESFRASYEDNVRLQPRIMSLIVRLWQRAVYLSVIDAADRLNGSDLLGAFAATHGETSLEQDISDLRELIVAPQTWGEWSNVAGAASENPKVQTALQALEDAYLTTTNQYRRACHISGEAMRRYYPTR